MSNAELKQLWISLMDDKAVGCQYFNINVMATRMWRVAVTYKTPQHDTVFYKIQLKIIGSNKSKDNLITILWKMASTALSHLSHYLQKDILDNLLSHTHMIHMWRKECREWWGRLYSFQCQLSSTNKQKKHFKNENKEDVKYVNASQILHSSGGFCIISQTNGQLANIAAKA